MGVPLPAPAAAAAAPPTSIPLIPPQAIDLSHSIHIFWRIRHHRKLLEIGPKKKVWLGILIKLILDPDFCMTDPRVRFYRHTPSKQPPPPSTSSCSMLETSVVAAFDRLPL